MKVSTLVPSGSSLSTLHRRDAILGISKISQHKAELSRRVEMGGAGGDEDWEDEVPEELEDDTMAMSLYRDLGFSYKQYASWPLLAWY